MRSCSGSLDWLWLFTVLWVTTKQLNVFYHWWWRWLQLKSVFWTIRKLQIIYWQLKSAEEWTAWSISYTRQPKRTRAKYTERNVRRLSELFKHVHWPLYVFTEKGSELTSLQETCTSAVWTRKFLLYGFQIQQETGTILLKMSPLHICAILNFISVVFLLFVFYYRLMLLCDWLWLSTVHNDLMALCETIIHYIYHKYDVVSRPWIILFEWGCRLGSAACDQTTEMCEMFVLRVTATFSAAPFCSLS